MSHIKRLLKVTGLEMAKPRSTPMEPNTKYKKSSDNFSADETFKYRYRRLIGNLLYISQLTRPDITYAVNYLSRFQNNPTEDHFAGIKRIIRYLSGTLNHGLIYTKGENEDLYGYADASWGEDIEDRKSTTGYCFMVCGKLVQWRSCKQTVMALSSCEAEYIALSETIKEGRYIQALCKFFSLNVKNYNIFEDNQSAIAIASNMESKKGKAIDIRYHSVREALRKGEIQLTYTRSQDNVADTLTKPLGSTMLYNIRTKIGVVNISEVEL